MSDHYREKVKSAKPKSSIIFLWIAVAMIIMIATGCSEPKETDAENATLQPETTVISVSSLLGTEASSKPEQTEEISLIQENLDKSEAFQTEMAKAVKNGPGYFEYNNMVFKIGEITNPATDTLDGYYFTSLTRTGGIENWERLYVPAEFDQYPILYITYTTVSLYIPDGPVICLGEETPGLVLEEDERTGDMAGKIDGWYVRYPAQPENEYEMLIYKDDTLEYAIKTRHVINENSNSIRNAGNEQLSRYAYLGCADKQLFYTFVIGYGQRTVDLERFFGDLTEDMITVVSTSD